LIFFGIIGLGVGGKLTTEGALGVAAMLGVADTAVGLTIVALGTSLPELAAGIAAALRHHAGVVIGNVIGSSIFNILGIVGLTAIAVPLSVPQTIISFDIWVMICATLLLAPVAFFTRKIGRTHGLLMTLLYASYIILVFRNGGDI
jgi:cation:H+ antiporter